MSREAIPTLVLAAALAVAATDGAVAGSTYTRIDTDACEVVKTYEDGAADLRCPGLDGLEVFVNGGDARTDVDFGVRNDNFESFSAFNGTGETVEWVSDDGGAPYATILRFLIDVDGRSAEALVVSLIGSESEAGCVIGVVDAATEQANGAARGLAALAPTFDCAIDPVVVLPGANELVRGFNGANGTRGSGS
jgi:hypothetical protein